MLSILAAVTSILFLGLASTDLVVSSYNRDELNNMGVEDYD